jgi:polyhydroxyalkanoate synthesis regulator phasin
VTDRPKEESVPSPKQNLTEMKRKLRELIRSRSQATCSSVVSTEIDVRREMQIEELEEQIRALEHKSKAK